MSDDQQSVRISDIAAAIEQWAPPGAAQSYDNVGLQIGSPDAVAERVLVALEITPAVIEEATRLRANLVVTHHPLIFRPLKNLTSTSFTSALALRLAERGIALYSAHTNLDAARDGVSYALAARLDLQEVSFLQRAPDSVLKLVTFVPASHTAVVRQALAEAGAGRIGDYDACAFETPGTGYFRAGADANPFIGTAGGGVERADEVRVEVELSRWDLGGALAALHDAHPYEEVAYDVYPVLQDSTRFGLGAIGNLPAPVSLRVLLGTIQERLDVGAIRFAGDPEMEIRRVAVCGGAGSDLIGVALRAGADVLVTGDVTYHRFFETMRADGAIRMAIVDAGHYETEAATEALLQDRLARQFPGVDFVRTSVRTSPVQYYTGSHPA